MAFIPRQIESSLRAQLQKFPILALTGPRQSGKTTLLKNAFPDFDYVSLEDGDARSFAATDPVGFLEKHPRRVIFDEAQRSPELFSYLQTRVDSSGEMGQFILSGSQNFHLMERISQSLAGRVAIFRLLPFDFSELKNAGFLSKNWREIAAKGFYPPVFDREIEPPIFYSNYLQTYIDRDVSALTQVQDLRRFRNFIALCAARVGQMLNLNALANECGISQPTAKSWLAILESSYIAFQLPPYFENFNKRIVKTPKLYFYDTGLVAFLLGLRRADELFEQPTAGALFENMIVAEFQKRNFHQNRLQEFWFWRDSAGNEIDLMTRSGLGFDVFEIKSSQTILPAMFKNLDAFSTLVGEKVRSKNVIYGGSESQSRTAHQVWAWSDSGF